MRLATLEYSNMAPLWQFFEFIVCLNHPAAKKRWDDSLKEFEKVQLRNVLRFESVPSIGPHQSFNLSMKAILRAFVESNSETLLIIEDDVNFQDITHLNDALCQLPENWDIFYLGANLTEKSFQKPNRTAPNICRVFDAWATHCIAFTKPVAKYIIENVPHESAQMFDNWLSSQLHKFNCYIITPMIAYQRPGESLIWGGAVNYDSIWTETDNLLKSI